MALNVTLPDIGVVDYGSQSTTLLQRRLSEEGFRSIILQPEQAEAWLQSGQRKSLILSGSFASVHDKEALLLPQSVLDASIPILGVCYGMQKLVHVSGGTVEESLPEDREFNEAVVEFQTTDPLFRGLDKEGIVWMSHSDGVKRLPPGFHSIAQSKVSRAITAMVNPTRRLYGVQFHPEAIHTPQGGKILRNFVTLVCGCEPDWNPGDTAREIQDEIANDTRNGEHVVMGVSGGVDSSTGAQLAYEVLGKRLHTFSIDHGALRAYDSADVHRTMQWIGASFEMVDAAAEFQRAILGRGWGNDLPYGHPRTFAGRLKKGLVGFVDGFMGRTDAEEKRRRFKKAYTNVFNRRIATVREQQRAPVLAAQASLLPDFIESGRKGKAQLLKSHHNIGLLLDALQIHPFRELFKFEVKKIAIARGLPDYVIHRQPFPGPALYIRILGRPTLQRLATLRWADEKVMGILQAHDLLKEISQPVIALNCTPTVGIKGDGRVYGASVIGRFVQSADFMTVSSYPIPEPVRKEMITVVTRHPEIVRFNIDETPKPPGTTELE